jgi:hypothetical protein
MNNICLHTIKSIIILKICTFNICSRRNLAGGFGEKYTTITSIIRGKSHGIIRRVIENEYAGKRRKRAVYFLQQIFMQSVLNKKKRVCEHVSHK